MMASDPAATVAAPMRWAALRVAWAAAALACVGALLTVPSFAPWLSRVDYWTADWRTAYLSQRLAATHPAITVVAIDDDTLRDYASSPIDRGLLARIVSAVDAAGAKVIGIDVFFLKKTEPEKDAALVAALRDAKAAVVLGAVDERGDLQPFQREFQTSFLASTGRPAGYLNLRHERDDVVRYTASPAHGSATPKSFARLLLEAAGGPPADDVGKPIAWLLRPSPTADAFDKVRAQDLLSAKTAGDAAAALKGRIALIGGDFPLRDRHRTPLTVRDGVPMAGVMIHANILAGLLDPAHSIQELRPQTVRALIAIVAGLGFGLGWLLWRSTAINFVGWSTASAALVAIDALIFVQLRLLLPFTLLLVAWVAGIAAGRSLHMIAASLRQRRSAPA